MNRFLDLGMRGIGANYLIVCSRSYFYDVMLVASECSKQTIVMQHRNAPIICRYGNLSKIGIEFNGELYWVWNLDSTSTAPCYSRFLFMMFGSCI